MKNKLAFLWIAALVSGLTGCANDAPDGDRGVPAGPADDTGAYTEFIYSSGDEDAVTVFKGPGVEAAPASGFGYQIYRDGDLISSGTITLEGANLSFHCGGYGDFPAEIDGDRISFRGNVKKDNGDQTHIPGGLNRERNTGPNPFLGTWFGFADHESALTMTEDGWTYTNKLGVRNSGAYTRTGDTAAFWYSAGPGVTKIRKNYAQMRIHTRGVEFIKN
jgi:hypothetical protein